MFNEKILKSEEKAIFALRSIYTRFGYTRFKMNKFEEYDLYAKNKDSLISEGVITFTDTNGKLLALKPDVTLSIIKNSDTKTETKKLYYDESVYRISGSSHSFKEITQSGLECIGNIGLYEIVEVLYLAIKSLETIDSDYILDISHAGLFSAILDSCSLSADTRAKVTTAIKSKAKDLIAALIREGEISLKDGNRIGLLMTNYPDFKALRCAFENIEDEAIVLALNNFLAIGNELESLNKTSKLNIDFSIINSQDYYSGVVFKGYIKGIPSEVLSGGRYDKLMKKMGKNCGGLGFAVYLDVLERHNNKTKEVDYDCVVLKNNLSPATIIKQVESLSSDGDSVAVFDNLPKDVRYNSLVEPNEKGE